MRRAWMAVTALLVSATSVAAQQEVGVNTAVLFERYDFDSGVDFSSVSQLSVPITASATLGRAGVLTLSSGFTRIDVGGTGPDGEGELSLSGLVDTEARLVVPVVTDRVSLLFTAVAPTGIEALAVNEGPILTALTSQVIGFSTANLGAGGAAGAGVAGAVPVGRMALGVSGSYTHALAYEPLLGQAEEWKPGDELRIRAGLEGAVADNTYLRIASILAIRQDDRLDGKDQGAAGNRLHGYVAVNQGVGPSTLTVYLFDSYRSAPRVEPTAVGAVLLPKANLLGVGAKFIVTVARETRVMPRIEYRRLSEAARDDTGDGSLESAGSTIRFGADLKHPLNRNLALVLEANGLFGDVGNLQGGEVGMSGFRGGIQLEYRR